MSVASKNGIQHPPNLPFLWGLKHIETIKLWVVKMASMTSMVVATGGGHPKGRGRGPDRSLVPAANKTSRNDWRWAKT
jgi:hypothetical protein